ncbi:MAG: hypothetical protein ACRDWN_05250, partial [Acidimicrobiales bacterium]
IFVANSTWGNNGSGTCTGDGDNPFDAIRQGRATTTVAQIVAPGHFPGTTHGYNFTDDISKVGADCEGDVFVKDADTVNTPSGGVPGVAGNLTVAAANNVVVTGSLEYTDCGTKFATTNDHKSGCHYNTGTAAVNDSLGLIATNYVEVNRPGQPSCTTNYYGGGGYGGWGGGGGGWGGGGGGGGGTTTTCKASPVGLLGTCTKANVKDLTAVLCRPGSTVVIDAAILALSHSFAVDNYTVGGMTGQLGIFGAVAQDWRGAVGTIGSSGYTKDYNWDSRLQYVSIPYYLTPGTPSWALVSSSVRLTSHCPSWPAPYPSAGTTISPATTVDPSGNHGAC